jgi:uncharacterized spore protein YtfJ
MDNDPNLNNDMDDDELNEEMMEEFDFDDDYEDEANAMPGDRVLETIENNIDHMLDVASVEAVYGTPIKQRDTLIIPAAEVSAYMGFGMGVGSSGQDTESGESGGEGGGGGGGGFSLSRPVAVIVSGPDGVRVEPVVDATKIALAGITAGAFIFGMLARLGKMRRSFKALERNLTR